MYYGKRNRAFYLTRNLVAKATVADLLANANAADPSDRLSGVGGWLLLLLLLRLWMWR